MSNGLWTLVEDLVACCAFVLANSASLRGSPMRALGGSMLACSVSCVTLRKAHWAGHMQVPEVYAPFDVNISTRQLAGVREDTAGMAVR